MSRFCLLSTKLHDIPNHDDLRIVWVSSDDAPTELVNIDAHWKKYESSEACENDIKKVESERKFLVIFKDSVPGTDFENLCQIQSIYILLEKNSNLDYDSTNHPKVVGSFTNIDTLIDRLLKDFILTCRSDLPISISPAYEIKNEQSSTKLDGKTFMFLWNQLFIYYFVRPNEANMTQLKIDMLKQCELDYKDNEVQLENIKNFAENCSDENAAEWYTKDSFLYRILNKAFRTRNIDLMCKFQYFMSLLYKNFERLSKSQNENPSIVYRGQTMSKNELEKLKSNIGNLISINTILSTSRNKEAASLFVLGAQDAVIFRINIPKQNDNSFTSFIDISKISAMPSEEEVLFFMGTVFSINSIHHEIDSPCIIELTLNNDPSIHFRKLASMFLPAYFSFIKLDDSHAIDTIIDVFIQRIKGTPRSIMRTDDYNMIEQYYYILTGKQVSSNINPTIMIYTHLAFFFSNFGLYKEAIYLYKQAVSLKDISTTSPEFIIIHMIIGYLYYHSSEYDEALVHYYIVSSLLDENNLLTGELCRHLGDIQKKVNNVDTALSYYKDALRIADNRYIPSIQYINQEISRILKTQGNSNDARVYEIRSKKTDPEKYYLSEPTGNDQDKLNNYLSQLNDETEPVKRADLLYKIGICCLVQDRFEEALKYLLEAKSLYEIQPPSWDRFHGHLTTLFDNIAMLYLFFKDCFKALVMWRKAIDIRINFPSN